MQIGLLRPDVPACDRYLVQFSHNVTSQCGEDGIIAKVFSLIEETNRYAVEFGAWDGINFSNTHSLLRDKGWRGFLIEGNAERFAALQKTYAGNDRVVTRNQFVGIDTDLLDDILTDVGAPADLDLLSIDIDGCDYFVWESLQRFRPRLVIIEFNPSCPNDVLFVQDRDLSVNQGCSLLALALLGKRKGYELVCATKCNAFFVPQELFGRLGIADNALETLFEPTCDGRIFHGYDGTIHVVGMPGLLWHSVLLTDEDFQVLPRAMRRFGDAQKPK